MVKKATEITPQLIERYVDFIQRESVKRKTGKVISDDIEAGLGISGIAVREIRRHCWQYGIPIGSDTGGYYWITELSHVRSTKAQILSRIKALQEDMRWLEIIESHVACGQTQIRML